MSKERDYILTDSGELYHYGVLGMKWGKRKSNSAELPIGQNYTTPANESSSSSSGGGAPEEEEEDEAIDLMELAKKGDRFLETAKVWINDKLSLKVVDCITGKAQSMSWSQAKQWVDYTYRFADENHR